jgi:hypothetical protein
MYLHLPVSGRVWMKSFATIGVTQKQRFGALLSKKVSSLKTFDTQIVSGLLPCLFFGHSIEAPLR